MKEFSRKEIEQKFERILYWNLVTELIEFKLHVFSRFSVSRGLNNTGPDLLLLAID